MEQAGPSWLVLAWLHLPFSVWCLKTCLQHLSFSPSCEIPGLEAGASYLNTGPPAISHFCNQVSFQWSALLPPGPWSKVSALSSTCSFSQILIVFSVTSIFSPLGLLFSFCCSEWFIISYPISCLIRYPHWLSWTRWITCLCITPVCPVTAQTSTSPAISLDWICMLEFYPTNRLFPFQFLFHPVSCLQLCASMVRLLFAHIHSHHQVWSAMHIWALIFTILEMQRKERNC